MKNKILAGLTALLFATLVGCVQVHARDEHTIAETKDLQARTMEIMGESIANNTPVDAADKDALDIQFDALLTYEDAKDPEAKKKKEAADNE